MSSTDKKLKLLLFGAVGDKIPAFVSKVQALHKSKAGPFDLCFCVGSFHVPAEGSADFESLKALPIPVYVQDALTAAATNGSSDDQEDIQTLIEPNLKAFPSTKSNVYNISVPSHPHVNLVVASCPRSLRMDHANNNNNNNSSSNDKDIKPLMDKVAHVSYVGCDLLLTSHWPQGIEGLGDASVASQTRLSATYDVAEVALRARARYHMVPSHATVNQYWQSPPFFHLASTTSTQAPQHTGRLVALGAVSSDRKVPKQNKFVHALGLVPLHSMDVQELQQSLGQGVAPCPFTDASYSRDGAQAKHANNSHNNNKNGSGHYGPAATNTTTGFSEAHARRIVAEGANGGPQRWNLPKNRKRSAGGNGNDQDGEVDPTNMTLFVHGLHKDVSGQLQAASSITLLQAFQPHGVVKVRRPPNAATTSFAFLEFETHQQAKDCLETLGGETTVAGVNLTLKWGTHNNNSNKNQNGQHQHKRPRLTEEEAKDSSTLYFRLPVRILPDDLESASEQVRKWMEDTLEIALSEEGSRITAAEEPALQVEVRHAEGQHYGFLDFASHAAASMAMATLTGNTNGGIVECPEGEKCATDKTAGEDEKTEAKTEAGVETKTEAPKEEEVTKDEDVRNEDSATADEKKEVKTEPNPVDTDKESKMDTTDKEATTESKSEEPPSSNKWEKTWGLAMHWAHARPEKFEKTNGFIQDADCDFKFQRQHFPQDARQDCWFCLASEGCEKHLITGVYQQCYAAMPKGPIHKGHVLLIPVAHSSQGALMDKTASREIQDLQKALRRHAHDEYDMDLFVFERAIQTKGGYHTHMQCVPVPKGSGVKLETTLRAQAQANNLDLREIQSPDLVISTLLTQNEDDDGDGGYFYAEVPISGRQLEYKRFLYQVRSSQQPQESQHQGGRRGPMVPIQFGREVIAAVMGKKELAHWKSCQVDKEEETKMAQDLRQSFEKYYDVANN